MANQKKHLQRPPWLDDKNPRPPRLEAKARSVWAERWLWLVKAGGGLFIGSPFLAFAMAFATQDGTDVETKIDMAIFFMWMIPVGLLVALIGLIGYAVEKDAPVGNSPKVPRRWRDVT